MPDELQSKFEQTVRDVHQIKTEITSMKTKVDILHHALIGSEMTKDGGLVHRIIESERNIAILEGKIETLEKATDKRDMYIRIIWGLASAGIATVFTLVINKLLS